MIRLKDGCTSVFMRDGTCFRIALDEFERLVSEWTTGKTFARVQSVYGNVVVLKLAEVNGIAQSTAAAMRASDADDRLTDTEEKQREILDS